jgi:hypothetical protein
MKKAAKKKAPKRRSTRSATVPKAPTTRKRERPSNRDFDNFEIEAFEYEHQPDRFEEERHYDEISGEVNERDEEDAYYRNRSVIEQYGNRGYERNQREFFEYNLPTDRSEENSRRSGRSKSDARQRGQQNQRSGRNGRQQQGVQSRNNERQRDTERNGRAQQRGQSRMNERQRGEERNGTQNQRVRGREKNYEEQRRPGRRRTEQRAAIPLRREGSNNTEKRYRQGDNAPYGNRMLNRREDEQRQYQAKKRKEFPSRGSGHYRKTIDTDNTHSHRTGSRKYSRDERDRYLIRNVDNEDYAIHKGSEAYLPGYEDVSFGPTEKRKKYSNARGTDNYMGSFIEDDYYGGPEEDFYEEREMELYGHLGPALPHRRYPRIN